MTLANLLKIGRLKTHAPTGAEIRRLLAAAARNLADARVAAVRPLCCRRKPATQAASRLVERKPIKTK